MNARHQSYPSAHVERSSCVGSWWRSLDGDELGWSDAVYSIFGVSRNGFRPTVEAFRSFVHPEDRALVRARHEFAVVSGKPLDFEHRILRPNGEVRHVRERADFVGIKGINAKFLIGSVEDITEQKIQEASIPQLDLVRRLNNSVTSIRLCAESACVLRDQGKATDIALDTIKSAAEDTGDLVRALRRALRSSEQ